jgi:peptide/nickel transport system permease protein
LQTPSAQRWLGTDNLGRDQFTRLLYGGRTTLINAFLAVLISVVVGIPLGLMCGYYGGKIDNAVMRVWDFILSFPTLLMAFIFVAAFGRGSWNAVIAIGVVYIPMISKLSRSMTITERTKPYVEACVTFDYSDARIIFLHILPNCLATLLAELTLDIGMAIIALASLSFLGLGVQMPQSDWGAMLQEGMAIILKAPYLALGPTIVIVLTTVSLNVVSDGIQMYLDPEQRKLLTFKKFRAKMKV